MMTTPAAPAAAASRPTTRAQAAKAPAKRPKPAAKEGVPELRALHREWRSALEQHRLVVDARFEEVGKLLATGKGRRKTEDVAKEVGRLRLKPRKGRLRDLKSVDRLLEDLLEKLGD